MAQTIADVGDIPGKPPLSDAEKQAIADERNATPALPAVDDIPLSMQDQIDILNAKAGVTPQDRKAKKQAKRDAKEA